MMMRIQVKISLALVDILSNSNSISIHDVFRVIMLNYRRSWMMNGRIY